MAGRNNHEKGEGPKPECVLNGTPPGEYKQPGAEYPEVPFSNEKFEEIMELVAQAYSLTGICELIGMPSRRALSRWIFRNPELEPRLVAAKRVGVFFLVEKGERIIFDNSNDMVQRLAFNGPVPTMELDGIHVARARVIADWIKWYAGKINRVFADKQQIDLKVEDVTGILEAGRKRVAALRGKPSN